MDINQKRENLKKKLSESGWDRILADFIDSDSFPTLMDNLKEKADNGGITPPINQVFRAFYECPYNDLRVIIVGQDPYPKAGVADGLAFSSSNTMEVQPSLKVMFKEIQDSVYAPQAEDWYSWDPDLKRWARQGVLLLNTAFTTEPGKIGAHYEIWKPFTEYLFNKIAEHDAGLIFIFMGNAAKDWSKLIPETHYKLFCYHPASACYSGGIWESNDVFNRVNELIDGSNGYKISW